MLHSGKTRPHRKFVSARKPSGTVPENPLQDRSKDVNEVSPVHDVGSGPDMALPANDSSLCVPQRWWGMEGAPSEQQANTPSDQYTCFQLLLVK